MCWESVLGTAGQVLAAATIRSPRSRLPISRSSRRQRTECPVVAEWGTATSTLPQRRTRSSYCPSVLQSFVIGHRWWPASRSGGAALESGPRCTGGTRVAHLAHAWACPVMPVSGRACLGDWPADGRSRGLTAALAHEPCSAPCPPHGPLSRRRLQLHIWQGSLCKDLTLGVLAGEAELIV